jgi:hypothetical protein
MRAVSVRQAKQLQGAALAEWLRFASNLPTPKYEPKLRGPVGFRLRHLLGTQLATQDAYFRLFK